MDTKKRSTDILQKSLSSRSTVLSTTEYRSSKLYCICDEPIVHPKKNNGKVNPDCIGHQNLYAIKSRDTNAAVNIHKRQPPFFFAANGERRCFKEIVSWFDTIWKVDVGLSLSVKNGSRIPFWAFRVLLHSIIVLYAFSSNLHITNINNNLTTCTISEYDNVATGVLFWLTKQNVKGDPVILPRKHANWVLLQSWD